MSKINKIRINNEVYDIQDNSSGYVKGTEINYLVNQMVDEKIAEFLICHIVNIHKITVILIHTTFCQFPHQLAWQHAF